MKELEQLRADLATLRKAVQVSSDLGFPAITVGLKTVCSLAEKKIADLEAQQAQVDEWDEVQRVIRRHLQSGGHNVREVTQYVQHFESKVAELDHELRCERIDGGKVRDDQKAISAEKNREKLAELTTILNAIPPACGLARELVEKRIEGVKKEMQG